MGPVRWDALSWEDFKIEISIVGGILLYVLLAVTARNRSKQIALKWYNYTAAIWEKNFALLGNNGATLSRDGPRDYIFYASGRAHINDLYAFIHTKGQLDPIQLANDYVISNDSFNRVTYYARLRKNESDPITFAILPVEKVANFIKDRWDLTEFTKKQTLPGFPHEHYTVLSDAPEFTTMIWEDPAVKQAIFASIGLNEKGEGTPFNTPLIDSIVMSDLPYVKPEKMEDLDNPKLLKFEYRLPSISSPNARDIISGQAQLVIDLIDYVGQLGRLSFEGRERAKKRRAYAEEIVMKTKEKERKQELADKKYKEKKERAEAIMKLSPEEQRKAEEKERKKAAKEAAKKGLKKGRLAA
ncbi:Coiled-coil domain-containing protein 47 [Rhizophlyctis rosea]|nr:Coiled-coil domain-containing protein 47 [Rhizophlyctis rosea]